MRVEVLTLFPAMVRDALGHSVLGRAVAAGRLEVGVHDIRDHARGRHRQVDDTPYGGGPGMVMRVDVAHRAIEAVRRPESRVLLLDAGGRRFTQAVARELAALDHLVLLCGHYEGIDHRVHAFVHGSISIGDFVLTGGELAALVVVDATARLLPGVLGNASSAVEESFHEGLLEYPQYTRPRTYEGMEVPDVLLSGHHGRVGAWRREEARTRTRRHRPDLLAEDGAEE